jgi:ubiquinone/menaquinone biosynthesis C-methylase UbiE
MSWEVALFKKTGFGDYRNCLALLESYTRCASAGERLCLAAFVAIGSGLSRCLGADISNVWRKAETIIADISAASGLSSSQVIELLRRYVKLKLEEKDHLPVRQAQADIYNQSFYPVVTHFTFALQPSAMARLKYIREIVAAMSDSRAAVADLGCGSGLILTEVLLMKPSWIGHGLDVSEASIEYARRLALHKGVADRAQFIAKDIVRLPYEDESLDLVIASEVLEHLPEPELILMEIMRALRPGGQLILTIPIESVTPAHLQTFRNADEFLSVCKKTDFSVKRLNPQWHFSFGDDRRHLFAVLGKPIDASAKSDAETADQKEFAGAIRVA